MPNDTSTLLSPAYTFSGPGTYYPELTVYSGLLHKTVKDTVVISPLPTPQLGADILFCPGAPIILTLDAGPGEFYNWNGNFSPGSQTLAVADTGTYFVRVQQHGCAGYDTIHIARYEPATNDTIFYEKEYQLQATPDYASYQWSTGDTTYYINITEDGEYSITLQTAEGCTKLEKVMLIDRGFYRSATPNLPLPPTTHHFTLSLYLQIAPDV